MVKVGAVGEDVGIIIEYINESTKTYVIEQSRRYFFIDCKYSK